MDVSRPCLALLYGQSTMLMKPRLVLQLPAGLDRYRHPQPQMPQLGPIPHTRPDSLLSCRRQPDPDRVRLLRAPAEEVEVRGRDRDRSGCGERRVGRFEVGSGDRRGTGGGQTVQVGFQAGRLVYYLCE